MREQTPEERKTNFDEVPFGYSPEEAVLEADRCLKCKKPLCVTGCPVNVDIPGFIGLISEKKYSQAAAMIKQTNSLPAVCGRVCPQETQCEGKCILAKKGDPIAIGNLERFAADYERENAAAVTGKLKEKNGKKVAIVGAGPAGLTAAGDLIREGFDVTVFEALHSPGGVLVYGIPEFRLPKAIVQAEIDFLRQLGVKVRNNYIIGRICTIDELLSEKGFNAVFVGTGAGLPSFLGIPGENLIGVYSANEYLTRSNLMKAYKFPEYDTPIIRSSKVITVGGGNVAMDSARTALRLGAEKSIIVYRRSREEIPARDAEIHHAEEEGIDFKLLNNPVEIIGDDEGRVRTMKCIRMELGEPDDSGRRRPVPVEGSEFEIECDTVIIAIGNKPNPLIPQTTQEISVSRWGTILIDDNGQTSKKNVYAGGDIVTGAATVIEAMGAGKKAAESIMKTLVGK